MAADWVKVHSLSDPFRRTNFGLVSVVVARATRLAPLEISSMAPHLARSVWLPKDGEHLFVIEK